MRSKALLFLISLIATTAFLSLQVGCNEDDDEPTVEKKKNAWVVGATDSTGYGMILFSPDGGETWQRQGQNNPALQNTDLSDVWAIDENNVWVSGYNNTLLKTSDGGLNWSKVPLPSSLDNAVLISIHIHNKNNIWVGGGMADPDYGILYRSTDAGNTWTLIDTSFFRDLSIQGLCTFSAEKVYAVGGRITGSKNISGFIGYTMDGGTSWDSITLADNYNRWEWIGVVGSGSTIVVYGCEAHYAVSTDAGNTWHNKLVPNTGGMNGADVNDLIMFDEFTWWGAFDHGEIFLTTDGGDTWEQQQTPGLGGNFMVGIDAWDKDLALSLPFSDVWPSRCPIIKTTDGGNTWEKKHTCHSNLWKVTFIK